MNRKFNPEAVRHKVLPILKQATWTGHQCLSSSPFRKDEHPSFSFNAELGCWHDKATGESGGLKDFFGRLNLNWNEIRGEIMEGTFDGNGGNRETQKTNNQTIHPYRDENGILLFEAVRFYKNGGKIMFQRRPDGNGGYISNLNNVRLIPYRLPEFLQSILQGIRQVFISEGEKCTDILRKYGQTATCNPMGAGKWKDEYCQYFPQNAEIFILPDADKPGQKHSQQVAFSFISQGFKNIKIINLGYPIVEKHGKDIYDWFQEGHTKEELLDLAERTPTFTGEEDEENGNGEPDGTDSDSLNFPIDAMPKVVIPLIQRTAEALGTEPDLIAIPMLTVLGAAIGNNIQVEIAPGHVEKANLFTAVVCPPGAKKTPSLKIAQEPLVRRQKLDIERHELKTEESRKKWQEWQKRRDSISKGQGKISEPEPEKICKKSQPIYYITDATTEAIAVCHQLNPRGLILIFDELTGLVNSFNQYKGGKGSDRQFYLRAWSSEPILSTRKGREASNGIEYISVPDPCISITGGLQPSELSKIIDNKGNSSDGFAQRFLISYPEYIPTFYRDVGGIPKEMKTDYQELFDNLFDFSTRELTLHLSPVAKQIWVEGYNTIVKESTCGNLLEAEKETWSKMAGQAARIALIIHCCRVVTENISTTIDEKSMIMAWNLIEYFKSHIRKIYRELKNENKKNNNKIIIDYIRSCPGNLVSIRDIQVNRRIGNSNTIKLILEKMIEKEILKEVKQGKKTAYTFSEKFLEGGMI